MAKPPSSFETTQAYIIIRANQLRQPQQAKLDFLTGTQQPCSTSHTMEPLQSNGSAPSRIGFTNNSRTLPSNILHHPSEPQFTNQTRANLARHNQPPRPDLKLLNHLEPLPSSTGSWNSNVFWPECRSTRTPLETSVGSIASKASSLPRYSIAPAEICTNEPSTANHWTLPANLIQRLMIKTEAPACTFLCSRI